MQYLYAIILMMTTIAAHALPINIYLKYDEKDLRPFIENINGYLEAHGIFDKYKIRPFLENYPLHTTLYLTDYAPAAVPKVIEKVKLISSKWHKLNTFTTTIHVSAGGYVMLDVDISNMPNGLNHLLQSYSNDIVSNISPLRNANAPIPDWAQNHLSKRRAFSRYGSPNVFSEFRPHFTLMAKDFKLETAKQIQQEVGQLIKDYVKANPKNSLKITAIQIAIGETNEYGQITKELIAFDLN